MPPRPTPTAIAGIRGRHDHHKSSIRRTMRGGFRRCRRSKSVAGRFPPSARHHPNIAPTPTVIAYTMRSREPRWSLIRPTPAMSCRRGLIRVVEVCDPDVVLSGFSVSPERCPIAGDAEHIVRVSCRESGGSAYRRAGSRNQNLLQSGIRIEPRAGHARTRDSLIWIWGWTAGEYGFAVPHSGASSLSRRSGFPD